LGHRNLPTGITYNIGSDWLTLSQDFIHYLLYNQNVPLLQGLFSIFNYTIVSAERFYLAALKNSQFCTRHFDGNLRLLSMDPDKKKGCHLNRPSVDFNGCNKDNVTGCSPYAFTMERWHLIEKAILQNDKFLARKFDSTIDISVLNKIDKSIYGLDLPTKYWLNIWHHKYS